MKYIKYLLLSFVLFFILIVNCNASTKTFERSKDNLLIPKSVKVTDDIINDVLKTKAVDASEKIYDFAELLTDGEEKQLLKSIKGYTKDTKFDLVVVTTKELDGFNVGDYANNFYKYNNFNDDGVLFLISTATSDTSIYMVNNGKAKNIYGEGLVSSALKYVYPNIKEKKYSDALDDYVKILDKYYMRENEKDDEPIYNKEEVNNKGSISTGNIILLAVALAFLISMIIYYVITRKKIKRLSEQREALKNSKFKMVSNMESISQSQNNVSQENNDDKTNEK